jgi:uncharacterized protein with NRDE domain
MCVVSVAWNAHPQWRLVVAGNRDEYHARASAPLGRWDDFPGIIAGRDLVSGGSWMGISETGRFAVVTNIRDADGPDPARQSRGALVKDWLAAEAVPEALDTFNPFNLFLASTTQAEHLSNRPEALRQPLTRGIYGLSNAILDEHWPRKDRLNAVMADWLAGAADAPETLLDFLGDEQLPDREAYPIFIRSPVYGTRCGTVVAVDMDGRGRIIERRFDANGNATGETSIGFNWA